MMIKFKHVFLLGCLAVGQLVTAQVKIGDNPTTIGASSLLELESANKALLVTRVASTSLVVAPVNGMLVYDISAQCFKGYENGAWSPCLSSGAVTPTNSVTNDCDANGFNGAFIGGVALTSGASFSVTIKNNAFATSTISFATSDLVLSGVAGISVSAVSTPSATLTAGQSITVSYTLAGTPSGNGTLTATWSKLSLSCTKTKTVSDAATALNDTAYCTNAALNGNFVQGVAMNASNTFTVTIKNNSGSTISNLSAPAVANLALSGAGSAGISVASVSPNTTFSLNDNQTRIITYTLSGTPTALGSVTATWNYAGFTCAKSRLSNTGSATFTMPGTRYVVSYEDGGQTQQGVVSNTSPNQIVLQIPYSGGAGSLAAVSNQQVTAATAGQGGDVNSFSYSHPGVANLATAGTLNVTINIDGDGSYNVERLLFGQQETFVTIPFVVNGETKGNLSIGALGGIPDRAFGQTINGANNHNFIYAAVVAADGKTWLNNNLGASYANKDKPAVFNPGQAATGLHDFNAYGSCFQWGRKADGHELMTWTGAQAGTSVNGTTTVKADNPANALFILVPASGNFNWRVNTDSNLWNGETAANNPCPVGYRLPTNVEFTSLINSENLNSPQNFNGSTIRFAAQNERDDEDVTLDGGTGGYLWTGTPDGTTNSWYVANNAVGMGVATSNGLRGMGRAVRCIKQ